MQSDNFYEFGSWIIKHRCNTIFDIKNAIAMSIIQKMILSDRMYITYMCYSQFMLTEATWKWELCLPALAHCFNYFWWKICMQCNACAMKQCEYWLKAIRLQNVCLPKMHFWFLYISVSKTTYELSIVMYFHVSVSNFLMKFKPTLLKWDKYNHWGYSEKCSKNWIFVFALAMALAMPCV